MRKPDRREEMRRLLAMVALDIESGHVGVEQVVRDARRAGALHEAR